MASINKAAGASDNNKPDQDTPAQFSKNEEDNMNLKAKLKALLNRLNTRLAQEDANAQIKAISEQFKSTGIVEQVSSMATLIPKFITLLSLPKLDFHKDMAEDVQDIFDGTKAHYDVIKKTTTELDRLTTDISAEDLRRFYRQFNIKKAIAEFKEWQDGLAANEEGIVELIARSEGPEAAAVEAPVVSGTGDEVVDPAGQEAGVEEEGGEGEAESAGAAATEEKDVVDRLRALSVGKLVDGAKKKMAEKKLLGQKKKAEHTRLV